MPESQSVSHLSIYDIRVECATNDPKLIYFGFREDGQLGGGREVLV